MVKIEHIVAAVLTVFTACSTQDLTLVIPMSQDRQVEVAGLLHSADSVHYLWGAYCLPDGAVEAADLHLKVYVNGSLEAEATSDPSDYPYKNPAQYSFKAHFSERDSIIIVAGEAFAQIQVPPPPDTVRIQMSTSVGKRNARFLTEVRGSGYYRVSLEIEKLLLDSSGRVVHLVRSSGPSKLFSIEDDGAVIRLDVPWETLSTVRKYSGAVLMRSKVLVRVSSLSRNTFAWYNAWSSDKADNMFSILADPARFPDNVEGGYGLVDITSDVERVIVAGEFDLN